MRQRIAIIGGGITAGMAARLLAPLGETTLFQPGTLQASGMPEIVPRRSFFSALGERGEDEWVAEMAPSLTEVSWRNGTRLRTVRLASTEDFLVYDKARLARLLLDGASVAHRITGEVCEIAELQGFDRIFDCRGARAVKNDPAYQLREIHPAHTACRYLVVSASPEGHDGIMRFWSETVPGGNRRTFRQSIERAIWDAGITSSALDHVNLHASGTQQNDQAEYQALVDVIGPNLPPITAFKGNHGHALGGANMIEIALAWKMMTTGLLPPTAESLPVDAYEAVPPREQAVSITMAPLLKTASGFSGIHAAIIMENGNV